MHNGRTIEYLSAQTKKTTTHINMVPCTNKKNNNTYKYGEVKINDGLQTEN